MTINLTIRATYQTGGDLPENRLALVRWVELVLHRRLPGILSSEQYDGSRDWKAARVETRIESEATE